MKKYEFEFGEPPNADSSTVLSSLEIMRKNTHIHPLAILSYEGHYAFTGEKEHLMPIFSGCPWPFVTTITVANFIAKYDGPFEESPKIIEMMDKAADEGVRAANAYLFESENAYGYN